MYDVIVIGAGPAGASAALFTAKAGKSTVMLDSEQSVTKRAWLDNHYGAPSISGPDLVEVGKKQATGFGAELRVGKAVKLAASGDGVRVELEDGTALEGKHVILATGMFTDLAEASGIQVKPGTEPRIKTIVDADASGRTSMAGVWAAGTCAGVSMHTIITAGDGAAKAINIISELNGERYVDHDMMKA